jgi:hypothetical protein
MQVHPRVRPTLSQYSASSTPLNIARRDGIGRSARSRSDDLSRSPHPWERLKSSLQTQFHRDIHMMFLFSLAIVLLWWPVVSAEQSHSVRLSLPGDGKIGLLQPEFKQT